MLRIRVTHSCYFETCQKLIDRHYFFPNPKHWLILSYLLPDPHSLFCYGSDSHTVVTFRLPKANWSPLLFPKSEALVHLELFLAGSSFFFFYAPGSESHQAVTLRVAMSCLMRSVVMIRSIWLIPARCTISVIKLWPKKRNWTCKKILFDIVTKLKMCITLQ